MERDLPAFVSQPVVLKSPAAAYRADLAGRDHGFGPDDDGWIALATLLEHAALVSHPDREQLLCDAIELAQVILGEPELHRLSEREFQDRDRTPTEAIVLVADAMQRAGALNLAATLLDAVAGADESLNVVQRGRLMALRAVVAWKLGHLDEAAARYRQVGRWGRQARSTELATRAWLGFGAIAQMRGNYPAMFRYVRRAARLAARGGLRKLGRQAQVGLMVAAGAQHRFDEALDHGWKAYHASVGDVVEEGEVLCNLGQLLVEAGQSGAARAAFAAVVSRQLPALVLLPALGGLATVSASTGDVATLMWAVTEIDRIDRLTSPRAAVAQALLESAAALAASGSADDAERCRRRALALARAHGFHEVAYKAEELDVSSPRPATTTPRDLSDSAASVVREVTWLEPDRLPSHVSLAASVGVAS